jgi:hypothetical protein
LVGLGVEAWHTQDARSDQTNIYREDEDHQTLFHTQDARSDQTNIYRVTKTAKTHKLFGIVILQKLHTSPSSGLEGCPSAPTERIRRCSGWRNAVAKFSNGSH